MRKFTQRNRTTTTNNITKYIEPFGNGLYLIPGMVGMYTLGYFIKNEKLKRVALLSFESFAITGAFVYTLKVLTGRDRPSSGDGRMDWDGPNFRDVSFSSGHTAATFAIATIFAEEYKGQPWVPPLAYGLAAFTGLSRIHDNEHWASDVFLGAVIGYFTAKSILKLHTSPEANRLLIYPKTTTKAYSLQFTYFY